MCQSFKRCRKRWLFKRDFVCFWFCQIVATAIECIISLQSPNCRAVAIDYMCLVFIDNCLRPFLAYEWYSQPAIIRTTLLRTSLSRHLANGLTTAKSHWLNCSQFGGNLYTLRLMTDTSRYMLPSEFAFFCLTVCLFVALGTSGPEKVSELTIKIGFFLKRRSCHPRRKYR